jgi:polysaccharide biosynthesis/export protein
MTLTLLTETIDLASVSTILRPSFRFRLFSILTGALMLFLVPALSVNVAAQQNSESAPISQAAASTTSADDARYRIGAGDVISIMVRKAPELSGGVRVDQRGMIRIPMIEGDVRAACLTENELAAKIKTLYLEYKKNPNVEVFVAEFQSRPVAVIGAINAPGQFRLQRRVRLLELLSFAGGPATRAGRVINIIHAGGPNICDANASDASNVDSAQEISVYKLFDTLKGKEGSNPFVQAGDIVSLLEADQIFVIGHVNSPTAVFLKEQPITISRAIAMAGGPARDARTSRVRIIRQVDGANKQEILVDLNAISKHKAVDITLFPNDIVEVGGSATKTMLGILSGAIAPAISQGAVRIIP